MRWRVLAVVALAAMAGCSGFLGGTGEPEPVSTVTPVPVPSDVPRSGPGSLVVPGVHANGSLDVDALIEAHTSELAGGGFAWRIEENRTGYLGNTTATTETYRTVVFDNASHYYYDTNSRTIRYQRRRVFYPEYTEYADGEHVYVRGISNSREGVQWDRFRTRPGRSRFVDPTVTAIEWYLAVDRVSVSRFTTDGEVRYRLTATEPPAVLNNSAREYVVTAVVTPRGLVRTITATYRTKQDSPFGTIWFTHTYRLRITQVGNVSVPTPAWLETARQQFANDTETTTVGNVTGTAVNVSG